MYYYTIKLKSIDLVTLDNVTFLKDTKLKQEVMLTLSVLELAYLSSPQGKRYFLLSITLIQATEYRLTSDPSRKGQVTPTHSFTQWTQKVHLMSICFTNGLFIRQLLYL